MSRYEELQARFDEAYARLKDVVLSCSISDLSEDDRACARGMLEGLFRHFADALRQRDRQSRREALLASLPEEQRDLLTKR